MSRPRAFRDLSFITRPSTGRCFPEYNQSLFDPDQPYRYQLLAGLAGGMDVTGQIRFEGELQANIVSDYGGLQPSNSLLPHVRSDALQYFEKGKNGYPKRCRAPTRRRSRPGSMGSRA